MKYDFTHFTDELSKIKCTLNNSQLEQFELYYDMLIEKNKVMNLTAITDLFSRLNPDNTCAEQ